MKRTKPRPASRFRWDYYDLTIDLNFASSNVGDLNDQASRIIEDNLRIWAGEAAEDG